MAMKAKTMVVMAGISFGLILLAPFSGHADDCEEAKLKFNKALHMQHDPADAAALAEKEILYKQAVDLCPDYAEAHNNLGDVYENLARYDEAIAEYEKASKLQPKMATPLFSLGDVYLKTGRYQEAIEYYDRGLDLDPDDKATKALRRNAETILRSGGGKVLSKEKIVEVLGRQAVRGPGDAVSLAFRESAVPFDSDKYAIRDDAKAQLDELGLALQSQELNQYAFEIRGHTDLKGTDAYNLDLSLKRANAVKEYLVRKHSISEERLRVHGYGKARPIALGSDEAAHALNRRVEIVRFSKSGGDGPRSSGGKEKPIFLATGFIYQDEKTGLKRTISPAGDSRLKTGKNPYQIFFRPDQDCYVYLLQKDSRGKWFRLSPKVGTGHAVNPAREGKEYWVPAFDKGFPLDAALGEETLYLVASLWQVAALETSEADLATKASQVITSFKSRGSAGIGNPLKPSQPATPAGSEPDYAQAIQTLAGNGGMVQTVSFRHE